MFLSEKDWDGGRPPEDLSKKLSLRPNLNFYQKPKGGTCRLLHRGQLDQFSTEINLIPKTENLKFFLWTNDWLTKESADAGKWKLEKTDEGFLLFAT